jgi:hypothetical protein
MIVTERKTRDVPLEANVTLGAPFVRAILLQPSMQGALDPLVESTCFLRVF